MMTPEQWLIYAHQQGQIIGRMKTAINIVALAKARFPRPDENKAFMDGYLSERNNKANRNKIGFNK